jgi:predicted O-linked N-acetylglucosamine transferase (SPINDLY family)
VLCALPDTKLLIKCAAGEEPEIQASLRQKLQAQGIDPKRIDIQGLWTDQHHLGFYHQVDIVLDAYPFNAAVTALEALWMGVPSLSLTGPQTVSRTGISLMHQLDLVPLVLDSEDRVVKMAQVLCRDLDSLAAIRASLRQRMRTSSLMDARRYVQGLEAQLLGLWQEGAALNTGKSRHEAGDPTWARS